MQQAVTESVAFQRDLHVQEEKDAERTIKAEGCEIVELNDEQHGLSLPRCSRSIRTTAKSRRRPVWADQAILVACTETLSDWAPKRRLCWTVAGPYNRCK